MTDPSENPQDENIEQDLRDELEENYVDNSDEPEKQEDDQQESVEPELPPLEPNALWDEATKQRFPELDRETQQFLIDTSTNWQTGYNEKFTALANERREFESVAQAMQPLEGYLKQNGLTTAQGVGMFSQHMQNIFQDPIQGSITFLNSLGVDVNQLVGDKEDAPYVDPVMDEAIQKMRQENQQLQQQVSQITNERQSRMLAEQQGKIDAFAKQTNEQGHIAYPRFNELRKVMGQLMNGGVVADGDLVNAYRIADQANPMQAPPEVNNDALAHAQRAKVASKNIKSKSNSQPKATLSLREQLRRDMAKQIG